jgi:outer membrane protein assembly factor BamB
MGERHMIKQRWWKICFIVIVLILQNFLFIIIASPVTDLQECDQEKLYQQYRNDWRVRTNYCNNPVKNNYHFDTEETTDNNKIKLIAGSLDGPMYSSWPMQSHDMRHTGYSQYSTADNPGTEKWRYRTFDWGSVEASAVIDNDGIIYFGTIGGDSTLYALYPNCTKKWHFQTPGLIWSSPAIAEDETIYVGDWSSKLHAMYPDGQKKWVFSAGDPISTSPDIAENGTIYIGTMGGYFYAVNPNGTEQWRLYLGGNLISSPAIGQNSTIYIGTTSNYLYAVNPNGTIQWQFGAGQFKGNPSIATDGTIYAPCFDGYLYALYPNGTMKWRVSTGGSVSGAGVALANDGTIYVGTELIRAFYPNGTLKWSADVQGDIYGTVPAVSSDGTIYVSAGLSLAAVNPNGTIKWQKQISNYKAYSSPCISEDGTIYVGTSWTNQDGTFDWGYLHAFGDALLSVDAGGPYSGNAEMGIPFMSTIFGGALPYTYIWEFGDGNTSGEEHPTHAYARPGEYVATFTVIDGERNSSSDTANVSVGTSLPIVRILCPENALYLFNIKLMPLTLHPVIIGRIKIKVEAFQEDVGIDHVSFYIDSIYRYSDYEAPYEWVWSDRVFFFHDIGVAAQSKDGKWNGADIYNVLKFF